jgi:hypothetical protein
MSSQTGLHTPDDDVVARLRDASAVPDVRFDTPAVLATARQALRRRRRRQAFGGVVGVGLLALTLAGPVHLAGVGTLTIPGGHQVRTLLGVEDPDAPAPASGIDLTELLSPFDTEQPSPEQMAEEVASLRAYVLPVLEELEPTWYEEGPCDILEYPRGTFSEDGACGGRPAEQPFDAAARADLDRILDAVEQSGGPHQRADERKVCPGRHRRVCRFPTLRRRDRVELRLPVLARQTAGAVEEPAGPRHDHPDRGHRLVVREVAQRLSQAELTVRLGAVGALLGPVPSTYASRWSRPGPVADVVHGLSRWPS